MEKTEQHHQRTPIADSFLWAHLIPPVPIIASTMYRHYAKGNTDPLKYVQSFLIFIKKARLLNPGH